MCTERKIHRQNNIQKNIQGERKERNLPENQDTHIPGMQEYKYDAGDQSKLRQKKRQTQRQMERKERHFPQNKGVFQERKNAKMQCRER